MEKENASYNTPEPDPTIVPQLENYQKDSSLKLKQENKLEKSRSSNSSNVTYKNEFAVLTHTACTTHNPIHILQLKNVKQKALIMKYQELAYSLILAAVCNL